MAQSRPEPGAAVVTAMVCAGAVTAQFIVGKATRDALFLGSLDIASLPMMVVATAAFSILLVALSSITLRRIPPARVIPAAFLVNAALLLGAWLVVERSPAWAARAVYLQVSGLGPMLGSGFWLLATELFDPHTARRHFGRIAGVGTLTGLVSALVAERTAATFGVTAMLPVLAAISLVCAWQVWRLTQHDPRNLRTSAASRAAIGATAEGPLDGVTDLLPDSPRSGLRVLAQAPYLRNLATLVLLGTIGATLIDFVFKARAVETLGSGDALLRFFAIYYAGISLLAFAIQTTASSASLQRLGLALTASTPSIALAVGGLAGMVLPGLPGAVLARSGESVFRGSLFRTGYELFFTPVPLAEKRAAKSIIDVGFDRLGDAAGGALIRLLLLLPAANQANAILAGAVLCAIAALWVARRLNQGYIETLERSLLNRAVELDLGDVEDLTTRTTILRTLHSGTLPPRTRTMQPIAATSALATGADRDVQHIVALRSRDRDRVLAILRQDEPLPAVFIPHVIPLLAWDPVAQDAARALRRVVEERVGELTDALIDPNQPFAVRRRLARVFSTGVSQRAVDGLMLGLDDLRFEVRFQCGRSLAAIVAKNALVRIDAARVFDVVRREVAVGRPVWESHRLLDRIADEESPPFVDEFLKDRASQSLGHVFTLLSLVLPTTPLQIAYRGLHTDDPELRGTALEYLEGVLPADIRERLWPFLGDRADRSGQKRSRDEILAELLRSNDSIVLNLKELRQRTMKDKAPGPLPT